jgi:hypothetical protein
MRVLVALASFALLASVLLASATPAAAAPAANDGYDSRYAGESVFTGLPAGSSGQLSAIFFNAGTQAWAPGVVGLMICLADKTTCNVASPNAAYARNWYSQTVYATVTAPVSPGQNGFFVYDFLVPAGTQPNVVATFNGDVGLLSTGVLLHPEGYFQRNTAPALAGPGLVPTLELDTIASDGVSSTTLTVAIVDASGAPSATLGLTPITVTRQGSFAFCRITAVLQGVSPAIGKDGVSGTATGPVVRFTVSSTTLPGTCLIAVTGDATVTGTTIALNTRVVGQGAKLVVSSGAGSTQPASLSGNCTIAGVAAHNNDDPSCIAVTVDVVDLNGLRVTGDNTRVITASLDATSCAGGGRGDAVIQGSTSSSSPTAASTAVGGRVTFVLSSHGPYAGCRVTFTTPFLTGAGTTEAWSGI